MKNKPIFCIIIFAMIISTLFSCRQSEGEAEVSTLPPVESEGLPSENALTSVKTDDFIFTIYKTYAEITECISDKEQLVIPDTVTGVPVKSIAENAFFGNEKLVSVTLPSFLVEIGSHAFEECSALKTVIAGDKLEVVGMASFKNTPLEEISLPDTVYSIGKQAFYRTKITSFTVPSSVSVIENFVFYGCENLISIDFGKRVNMICDNAFYNCTSLTSLIIPDNILKIGDYTFRGCTSLSKIFIPKKTVLGENTFLSCPSLTVFTPKGSDAYSKAKTYGYNCEICSSGEKMTEAE